MTEFSIQNVIDHDMDEFNRYSSMLSKTIHDINNPLAVFIGQLSILEILLSKEEVDIDKIKKVATRFKSSANGFSTRLEHLRNFYKVPMNDSSFNSVSQIMTSLQYYFENELYKNSINLMLEDNSDYALTQLLPSELFIVLKHLIQNSVQASIESNKHDISLKVTQTDIDITFEISDQGDGLQGESTQYFEAGFSNWENKKQGLGLAIIKQILSKHASELKYQKSSSTSFNFTVKLQQE